MQPKKREVRIYGVPSDVVNSINNIAKNIGTDTSSLLKPKLKEIVDSYSPELRRPPDTK